MITRIGKIFRNKLAQGEYNKTNLVISMLKGEFDIKPWGLKAYLIAISIWNIMAQIYVDVQLDDLW